MPLMTVATDAYEEAIAELKRDPALSGLLGPDALLLLWDPAQSQMLWYSPAAAPLARALANDDGSVDPQLPFGEWLRKAGEMAGSAPGIRLERVRLGADRTGSATMLACRCLRFSERQALLTIIVGAAPVPRGKPATRMPPETRENRGTEAEPETRTPQEAVPPIRGSREVVSIEHLRTLPPRRFVWEMDAGGRFTAVSASLAEVVGPENACVAGRRWTDIVGQIVLDPTAGVADALAARAAWSNQPVLWRIADSRYLLPVRMSGVPVWGTLGRLDGFRGFGVRRPSEIVADPDMMAAEADLTGGEPEKLGLAHAGGSDIGGQVPTHHAHTPAAWAAGPAAEQSAHAETLGATGTTEDGEVFETEFGVLHARVGGQFGGSRSASLRLPSEQERPQARKSEQVSSDPESSQARSALSFSERGALHEIARALGARIEGSNDSEPTERRGPAAIVQMAQQPRARDLARLPDQVPIGLLVHRGEAVLYANRFLLDLVDPEQTGAAPSASDASALFARGLDSGLQPGQPTAPTLIMGPDVGRLVECRASAVEWGDATATLQIITPLEDANPALRMRALELDVAQRDRRLDELAAVLDLATDGIVILDGAGSILSLNPAAERLFGREQNDVAGEPITALLAPESHAVALAVIEALMGDQRAATKVDALEVVGRNPAGKQIPLSIVVGSIDTSEPALCVVVQDVSRPRELEGALAAAGRKAEDSDKQRTEFLARLSHEIRTPLNAIIGFAEMMLEERPEAAGSERHASYLRDIRQAGRQVIGLVDDLLDLARTGSGELAAPSTGADLNQAVARGVAEVQPVAARERIIVRTSFASGLTPVMADEAALRQIVTSLLSHAIHRSDAGGQVIASTALTDHGWIAFRVRDTGRTMSAQEIEATLQPFRQWPAGFRAGRAGSEAGPGLPLAKALVEARRGRLVVTSRPHEGTLVEVMFPAPRLLGGT
jgi:PAS domain S-box-containing protein